MTHIKIPIADPYITEEDVKAVTQAVRVKRLSQGEIVEKFEKAFARYVGTKYAVAVCNGTAALHAALAALGIGVGDEILVPSFSFIATANCILYQGAKPVFIDIDPLTYNIDSKGIEKRITKKTKAIIPVHFAGHPADMDPIIEIARKHNLSVIEDSAEAHGSLYRGRKVGSLGDMSCFSFYPNKNMTTGEGGIITTNNDKLAEKMRMIRHHGQDRRYHHIMLGYNYRMTDIQAALGITQLKRLDWVVEKKNEAAQYYTKQIKEIFQHMVIPPYVAKYATHSYMFYTVRFKKQKIRDHVAKRLEEAGVETRIAFPPIHLQPLYQKLFKYKPGSLPITEKVADIVLSLPIYPHITQEEQDYVLKKMSAP